MRLKSGILAVALILSVSSCVLTKAEGEMMMADISRLKSEISTLQREKSDFTITMNKKYDRFQSRLVALENSTYSKANSETSESEQLRRELERLRGELEETQRNIGTLPDNRKVKEIQDSAPSDKKEYFAWCKKAFDEGDFETALMRVNAFLEKYSDDASHGAKAFMLKGDASVFLAQNNSNDAAKKDFYKKAVTSYQDLLTRFPKSEHIPEGLFKVGETLEAMGFRKDAKIFFEEIKAKHSKSPFAKKATAKLTDLSKKSRNG